MGKVREGETLTQGKYNATIDAWRTLGSALVLLFVRSCLVDKGAKNM